MHIARTTAVQLACRCDRAKWQVDKCLRVLALVSLKCSFALTTSVHYRPMLTTRTNTLLSFTET